MRAIVVFSVTDPDNGTTLAAVSSRLQELDIPVLPEPLVRSVPPKRLLELEEAAAERSRELYPLRSLRAYWRIDLREYEDRVSEVVEALDALDNVTRPGRLPTFEPPGYTQHHLGVPAMAGINADWMHGQPSGRGADVRFVDIEHGWNRGHEDLPSTLGAVFFGANSTTPDHQRHGTAVLALVLAKHDATNIGVKGIAPDCACEGLAAVTDSDSLADAILAATDRLRAGDVILIEEQWIPDEANDLVRSGWPVEACDVDDGTFHAIRLASALGLIVIEPAGNRGHSLDANYPVLTERESGAIVVGACAVGEPATVGGDTSIPIGDSGPSNHGSRVDCFAWGERVVTAGYSGGLTETVTDEDRWYTNGFGGTSAAAAIIAGAAILLQGRYKASTGGVLEALDMRRALRSKGTSLSGLGVMPDLRRIVEEHLPSVPDVYARDNLADDGHVPTGGSVYASPDIWVTTTEPVPPLGAGTVGASSYGPATVTPGVDHWVCVRVKNRGSVKARRVRATVYYARPSTLLQPSSWEPIGVTDARDIPVGPKLTLLPPLHWPSARLPPTGQYSFIAVLEAVGDGALPPIGTIDSADFVSFVRNNNNVIWRNVFVLPPLLTAPTFFIGVPRGGSREQEIFVRLAGLRRARAALAIAKRRPFGDVAPWNRPKPRLAIKGRIARYTLKVPEEGLEARIELDQEPPPGTVISVLQRDGDTFVGGIQFRFRRRVDGEG